MSIPYVPQGTSKRFKVPRTLAADFDRFLSQDIPNTNMDFEILKNWFDKFDPNYEPKYIRGEIYPDSTKSRYENTDAIQNIRCSVYSDLRKGDMLIQPDGVIYIADWYVQRQSNNAPSRLLRCNMELTIKRFTQGEFDDDGYRLEAPGWNDIVKDLPANAYRYDGRPEYSAVSGTPGVTPNALTIMTVQYNDRTKKIEVDDKFLWGDDVYEVVDIDYVGVDFTQNFGTLKIQAKKAAGGLDYASH